MVLGLIRMNGKVCGGRAGRSKPQQVAASSFYIKHFVQSPTAILEEGKMVLCHPQHAEQVANIFRNIKRYPCRCQNSCNLRFPASCCSLRKFVALRCGLLQLLRLAPSRNVLLRGDLLGLLRFSAACCGLLLFAYIGVILK